MANPLESDLCHTPFLRATRSSRPDSRLRHLVRLEKRCGEEGLVAEDVQYARTEVGELLEGSKRFGAVERGIRAGFDVHVRVCGWVGMFLWVRIGRAGEVGAHESEDFLVLGGGQGDLSLGLLVRADCC